MNKKRNIVVVLALFGLLLCLPSVRANYTYATESNWASSAPTLDGTLDGVYTSYGPQIAWYITPWTPHKPGFNYIYILNDAAFLYIFVDLVSDNSTDAGDLLFVLLDSDLSETVVDSPLTTDRDDANFYNPSVNYSFAASVNGAHDHVQWEVKLNFSNMAGNPAPGEIIGYLFAIVGTLEPQHYYPANNYTVLNMNDESTYNKLQLATAPGLELSNLAWLLILVGAVAATFIITYLLMKRRA